MNYLFLAFQKSAILFTFFIVILNRDNYYINSTYRNNYSGHFEVVAVVVGFVEPYSNSTID